MARNPAPINVSSPRRVIRSDHQSRPFELVHKRRFISKLSPTSSLRFLSGSSKKNSSSGPSLVRASSRGTTRGVSTGRRRRRESFEARRVRQNTTARGARTGTRNVCKTRYDDDDEDASHRVRRRHHHASSLSTTFLTTRRRSSKNARVVATSRASLFSRKASKHQREREREHLIHSLINGV